MDPSAVVLNKLLHEPNIEIYSKLKLAFLDPAYSSVYSAIERHYKKHGDLPNFTTLELTNREANLEKLVVTLKLLDTSEIDIDVAFTALVDHYTQNLAVDLLDKYVDQLPLYDSAEIKSNLASIVMKIDEKTLTTEGVFTMDNIMLFRRPEEISAERVYLGINNSFDAALNGMAREEYLLIGGKRGSGKSIVASNLLTTQYEQGNTAVIFTIEMTGREIMERNMAILANVSHANIRKGTCTPEEILRLVKTRAAMFVDAEPLVQQFLKDRNQYEFELALVKKCTLKPDNQIIIIDDRALTTTTVDLQLSKLKNKFGKKLTLGIVDYINQMTIEGSNANKYDWQPQVEVSTRLKDFARKYDIGMASPYQIDEGGGARFAKGILDPADIALVLEAHDKETGAISFETTKIRGSSEAKFTSPINWETLRISPQDMEPPRKEPKGEKKGKIKNAAASSNESAQETDLF